MKVTHIPCGAYANESERIACDRLKVKLQADSSQDRYIFLTNIPFNFQSHGLSDEIDILVISTKGVIVIEVKHWDLSYLKDNLAIAESEAERLNNKVKKVATKIRNKYDVGFVEGRILLTKGDQRIVKDKSKKEYRGITFYGLLDWQELMNFNEPSILDNQTIERVCKIIEPKTKVSLEGDIRTFAGLTNLELVSLKSERFRRVYKGVHVSRRDRVILNIFDLSASEEKKALEIARQEYETLQRLQKSPYLPRLLDSFQDAPEYPGEIYFYSVIDTMASSLEERSHDKNWPIEVRLDTAFKCINALNELHHPTDAEFPPILHRCLSPDSIHIKANGQPIFTELNLAKLPDGSISPYTVSFPGKEQYVAPEILKDGIGVADSRSDIYSLCKSLYILFDGKERDSLHSQELLEKGFTENPDNRISLEQLAEEFDILLQEKIQPGIEHDEETSILPIACWDEDIEIRFQGQYYKIVNKLGSGGIGATFKVIHVDKKDKSEFGSYVAKVIFNNKEGESALNAYRKARPYIDHQNLAAIYEIAPKWESNNFVALMKWMEGMPLSELTGVLPLYIEDIGEALLEPLILQWLRDLCDALGALHVVNLVHGDVTPKNIIVSGGNVTLTDYDSVTGSGSEPFIYTALYCSPHVQKGKYIEPSDDIFALAASFFHVLFDKEPFRIEGELRKDNGFNYQGIDIGDFPFLIKFFDRAVNLDSTKRFKNGLEARNFLKELLSRFSNDIDIDQYDAEQVSQALSANEVPRLLDILRSYPGSLKGNDETRGLDSEFAEMTYVETRLDNALLDEINNKEVSLVILFGNAGDGKTAFLQHLAMKLGLKKRHSSERIWNHELSNGIRIRANLDGSASYQGRSATELLNEFFQPFHDCNTPDNLVHLVAINSGKLQEWIIDYEHSNGETQLTEQLQKALEGNIQSLDKRFRFLDLNNRSLVGGIGEKLNEITTDFLDNLLDKLIGDKIGNMWEPCITCRANSYCSAWESVQLLCDEETKSIIRERLYSALQAVHQRGEIHITARELRAAISYIFFGIHYCTDLHDNPDINPGHYYNRAFDPDSLCRQGEVLKELIFFDPALEAHAKVDRHLLGRKGSQNYFTSPSYPELLLQSARRKAFFEWQTQDIERILSDKGYFGLARGRHLDKFKMLPLMPNESRRQSCRDLCDGIARLEDLPLVAFNNGVPFRITPRTPTESTLWVIKPYDSFALNYKSNSTTERLETLHTHLELIYNYDNGGTEKLNLGYELFHILMELKNGVQLSDAASEDTFANLSIFTQRLTQEDSKRLLAWNPIKEETVFNIEVKFKNSVQTITCSPDI